MDELERLQDSYLAQQPSSAGEAEYPGKIDVIQEIELLEDKRALDFFLSILKDVNEYDLARVEVLKILLTRDFGEENAGRISGSIEEVLQEDPDEMVKQYAAQALARFMQVEGVYEFAAELVAYEHEDSVVRGTLLSIIEDYGKSDKSVETLKRLVSDKELGRLAISILQEWHEL
jgi:hypothetical protein